MNKHLLYLIVLMFLGTMSIKAQSDTGGQDFIRGFTEASWKNYASAIKHYQVAISKGNPDATMGMGDLYAKGNGVAQSDIEAKSWYKKGENLYIKLAQAGDIKAITKLSDLYFYGDKLDKNYAESLKYTLLLGTEMSRFQMSRIGEIYEKGGYGVTKDHVKAAEWYLRAYDYSYDTSAALRRLNIAVPENLSAEDDYARRLAKADTEPNPSYYRGVSLNTYAEKLKNEGVSAAIIKQKLIEKLQQMIDIDFYGSYLGVANINSIPVQELLVIYTAEQKAVIKEIADFTMKKTKYPASAPKPGMPWGMRGQQSSQKALVQTQKTNPGEEEFNKGLTFYKQDKFEEALIWYTKSAEKGQPAAMHNLGIMYMHGQGTAIDADKVIKWMREASDNNYAPSMSVLGALYYVGYGMDKNSSEAFKWLKKAAEAGVNNEAALELLALSYEHGLGTTQNYAEAEKWYSKAIEAGSKAAEISLKLLRLNKSKLNMAKAKFANKNVPAQFISFKGKNNKSGLKDEIGKVIIPAKYENINPISFSDGMAKVMLSKKWGFINQDAKEVIAPKYEQVNDFFNGVAAVKLGEKWRLIDKTGKEIVPPIYDYIRWMTDGMIAVKKGGTTDDLFSEGGEWGFINETGQEVIPLKYDFVGNFSEGLVNVELNGKKSYIDKTGKEIIPPNYTLTYPFKEGLAIVERNNKKGFINTKGEEIIPFAYGGLGGFSEGMSWFRTPYSSETKYKMGYMDKTGKEIVSPKYDKADSFSEGLAAVGIGNTNLLGTFNGLIGFIDKAGKEVIPLRYEDAGKFSEGLAAVKLSDKWGFIDKNGIVIIPLEYSAKFIYIGYDTPVFENGLAEVVKDGRIIAIDKTGKLVADLGAEYEISKSENKATNVIRESMERIEQAEKEATEKIRKINEETKELLEVMKK